MQLPAQHISSVSHSAALARFPGPPQGGHRVVTLPGSGTGPQNGRSAPSRPTQTANQDRQLVIARVCWSGTAAPVHPLTAYPLPSQA